MRAIELAKEIQLMMNIAPDLDKGLVVMLMEMGMALDQLFQVILIFTDIFTLPNTDLRKV